MHEPDIDFKQLPFSNFQALSTLQKITPLSVTKHQPAIMPLGSAEQQAKGESTQKSAEAERGAKDFKTNVQETVSC